MKSIPSRSALVLTFALLAALMLASPACAQTKTFEDYAPYTLESFLKGYNIISFGDAQMDIHCMGGVLIAGDFTTSNWCGFADGENLPPSYIGGYAKGPVYNSRNAATNAPLYVGASNTVTVSDGRYALNGKQTGNGGKTPVYKSDGFIDMLKVFNAIVSSAEVMRKDCTPLPLTGGDAYISVGSSVSVNAEDIPDWGGNAHINGSMDQPVNTIITIEGTGRIQMPTVWINGSQLNSTEVSDSGTSVIWYLPNATEVALGAAPWLGHLIAPKAKITMPTGNYNGCLIGAGIDVGSEGHLYNFNGASLPQHPDPTPDETETPAPDETTTPAPELTPTPTLSPTPGATVDPEIIEALPETGDSSSIAVWLALAAGACLAILILSRRRSA